MRDRSMMHSARRRTPLVVLAIVGALTLTSTTRAQAQAKAPTTQTPQARAAELFNKGAEAYRRGDFKQAVALLLEARTLDPQPVLLYNLGRAYEDSGEVDAAIATFQKYIEEDPKATDRGAIEQRIERLKRQRDERAALEKQRDAERMRADAEKADRERQEREAQKARPRSVGPYIVAGVGVAGLGTGVVFGLLSKSKHDSASKASTSQEDAIDQQDTAKSFATISTVSFIAGGVLVAAGATWWILDRRASSKPAVGGMPQTFRVGLTPGFLILERGFQ
jgi:tetratricopeptide (TPR) repeat protein